MSASRDRAAPVTVELWVDPAVDGTHAVTWPNGILIGAFTPQMMAERGIPLPRAPFVGPCGETEEEARDLVARTLGNPDHYDLLYVRARAKQVDTCARMLAEYDGETT